MEQPNQPAMQDQLDHLDHMEEYFRSIVQVIVDLTRERDSLRLEIQHLRNENGQLARLIQRFVQQQQEQLQDRTHRR